MEQVKLEQVMLEDVLQTPLSDIEGYIAAGLRNDDELFACSEIIDARDAGNVSGVSDALYLRALDAMRDYVRGKLAVDRAWKPSRGDSDGSVWDLIRELSDREPVNEFGQTYH